MDLDPFTPVGITQTMRFLDILLLHCLLEDSPPDTPQELETIARNKLRGAQEDASPACASSAAATRSRSPSGARKCSTRASRSPPSSMPRAAAPGTGTLLNPRKLGDAETTPSARVHAMARNHGNSHVRFTLAESLAHHATLPASRCRPQPRSASRS